MNIRYILIIILSSLLTASCISNAEISDEKRFSMLFNAANVGETLTIGEDELYISELKFALDNISLVTEEDFVFETRSDITAIIFAYNDALSGNRLIIEVGLGVSDDLGFNAYTMFVEPVSSRLNVFDDDFFGTDTNYSVVIKGTVNDLEFEYKSSRVFDKVFSFNRVELDDVNETIVFTKSIDAELVFTGENGELLDPTIQENNESIFLNLVNNLQVNVTSEDVY